MTPCADMLGPGPDGMGLRNLNSGPADQKDLAAEPWKLRHYHPKSLWVKIRAELCSE